MEEEEDVKKMIDFIQKQKSTYEGNYHLEFQDFINFKQDKGDQEFDEEIDEDEISSEADIKSFLSEPTSEEKLVLTEEEQNTIDSCTNPDLKRLLILNRTKNIQLLKLHKKMQQLLLECEDEIEEKRATRKTFNNKQPCQTYVWKLAAPYFKDKKFFPCPINEDVLRKHANKELSIYDMTPSPKWTTIEFNRLLNAVKCNYNINRQNSVMDKITNLKAKLHDEDDKELVEELVKSKAELKKLKNDEQIPPLNSNDCINWYKVAETFYKDKHTALECKAVWHMLVHPDINKSEWSEEENRNLIRIAKAHGCQNWEEIARKLNTNRTSFTTCLHYFSKLCDKFKKSRFSPEEDTFLMEVVNTYKNGSYIPWNKVVCHFTDRSRHQLYHRYMYFLTRCNVKRGKFSEAEDILLMVLVNKFGRSFKKCAEYMPNRSQMQLKSRYNTNLQQLVKKGSYEPDEDQTIYDHVQKNGEKNWVQLSIKLKRSGPQLRHRYKLIKQFLTENPGSSVRDVPRRSNRIEEMNGEKYNFLSYMAEQYQNVDFIPTVEMIEESLQVNSIITLQSEPKVKNIDDMLTDFFINSKEAKDDNVINETNLNEATQNVMEVLNMLGAKLNLPKNLQCNAYLDHIDVEILERISNKVGTTESSIIKTFPPNLGTLNGLKNLIIKHKEFKSKKHKKKISPEEEGTSEMQFQRELFSERFNALFHWSAISSLEKPNQIEFIECNNSNTDSQPKTYKRQKSIDCSSAARKRHLDVSDVNHKKNVKFRAVDKNVIDKLLKVNNINLIKLDAPIAKAAVDGATDEQDRQDLERLNVVLRSIKSDTGRPSTSTCDEFQAISDDVQLLKEILKYEKVKVKAEPDP